MARILGSSGACGGRREREREEGDEEGEASGTGGGGEGFSRGAAAIYTLHVKRLKCPRRGMKLSSGGSSTVHSNLGATWMAFFCLALLHGLYVQCSIAV